MVRKNVGLDLVRKTIRQAYARAGLRRFRASDSLIRFLQTLTRGYA
jgi:predicted nuclease with TOPRIM domain